MPISSPSDLSGLVLDNDPAQTCYTDVAGTTPADVDDAVALLPDQTGGSGAADGEVSQSTSNQRPLLKEDANGHLYLDFDNTDDYLSNSVFSMGAQPFTLTLVLELKNTATQQGIMSGGNGARGIRAHDTSQKWQANWGSNVRRGTTSTSLTVLTWVIDGASSAVWVNGTNEGTGDVGSNAWTAGLYYGTNGPNLAMWLNGKLYRGLAYSRVLTDTEIGDLHTLLVGYYTGPAPGDPQTVSIGYQASQSAGFSPSMVVAPSVAQIGHQITQTQTYSPQITGGAGSVTVGFAPTATAGYSPTLVVGGETLAFGYQASTTQGYSPTSVPGSRMVTISYQGSTSTTYSPAFTPASTPLPITYLASTTQGYSPTVVPFVPDRAELLRLAATPRIPVRLLATA